MSNFSHPGLSRTGDRDSSRGRGLQATANFSPGSAIATFPRPLLCLPDADHVRTSCDWCMRPSSTATTGPSSSLSDVQTQTKLSVCTRCSYVVYCSRKCQSAAWKAVHKLECPALCKIRESVKSENWFVPTPVRAAMQLLLRLNAGDERALEAVGGVPFVTAQDRQGVLQGNVLGFSRDDQVWKDLGMQAMAALKFSGIELDGDRLAAAAEGTRAILCMLQTNAFDRRDKDVGAAGVFLDVDLAMANHSCVPNAYVCFVGRTAALRAEREIKVGEEIVISYIDNTLSKQKRHEALRLYHFECQCKRCKEDLDVYQVCQMSSTIPLNIFSLQPDLAPYTNPPIDRNALRSTPAPKQYLEAKMYAVEPLPSTIHDLVVRYSTREQNYAYALTLACFLATRCHPYSHVAPFSPWRVKGLMMIAQLLSQTAPLSAMGELGKTCPDRALTDILARMDQVSMCEAVLRLVVHYGPAAHSDDWEVLRNARELMDDIQQLQGRDRESAAIGAWAASPATPHPFIDEVVFGPIKELAEYGLGLIQREIKGDNRLVVLNTPAPWRQLVYTA